jgi:hypothetical protein
MPELDDVLKVGLGMILIKFFPDALGYASPSVAAFFSSGPKNLQESFFQTMYARDDFDNESDDIQNDFL